MVPLDAYLSVGWLAANGVLLFCAQRISRAVFALDAPSCHTLHTVTISVACVLLTATALGTFGLLHAGALLVGAPVVAFAVRRCPRRFGWTTNAASQRTVYVVEARGAAHEGGMFASARVGPWALLCAVLGSMALSHVILHGLLRFPSDWDCLAYHSPLIDQWLQARSLYAPDSPHWWLPGNSELVGLWLTGAFSGDFVASLNNVPATFLWGLGTIALVRELGFPAAWSKVTLLASLCVGVLLEQATNTSNDIAVVAFFVAGAAYALRFLSHGRPSDLVLCAALVGMLAGVKYFALGYAALLICTLTMLATATRGPRIGLRTLAITTGGLLTFGGYWYARNLLVSGSAIFPMGFGQGRPEMLYPDAWSTTFAGNGSPELLKLWLDAVWRFGGPCHWGAFVAAPLVVFWLIVSGSRDWRQGRRREAVQRLFLVSLLAGSAAVLAVTPMAVEDVPGTLNQIKSGYAPFRYGLCFLSVSVVAFAFCLRDVGDAIRRFLSRRAVGMVAADVRNGAAWDGARAWGRCLRLLELAPLAGFSAAVAAQIVARVWDAWKKYGASSTDTTLLALNILLAACVLALAWRALGGGRRVSCAFAVATVCVIVVGVAALSARWHQGFAKHYDRTCMTELFEELESTVASEIHLCVLYDHPYPFFGSRRQFRVMAPRWSPSPEAFVEYLTANGATHVVVQAKPARLWQLASRWVTEFNAAFTPLRFGQNLVLYRFNPQVALRSRPLHAPQLGALR